jgi:hypothetical protein
VEPAEEASFVFFLAALHQTFLTLLPIATIHHLPHSGRQVDTANKQVNVLGNSEYIMHSI